MEFFIGFQQKRIRLSSANFREKLVKDGSQKRQEVFVGRSATVEKSLSLQGLSEVLKKE